AGAGTTKIDDGPNDGIINFGEAFCTDFLVEPNIFMNALTLKTTAGGSALVDIFAPILFFIGPPDMSGGTLGLDWTNSPDCFVSGSSSCVVSDNTSIISITGGGGGS